MWVHCSHNNKTKTTQMKVEEIKVRVTPTLKKNFQEICENEETTMSNKINEYIVTEVRSKKIKEFKGETLTKNLIRFGVMNTQKRLYQKSELTNIKLNEDGMEFTELDKLNSKVFYGQFGHPDNDTIIHKYNATHSIKNFKIEGDWLIGDVTILNPSIIPILDKIEFRSRAYGWLAENGVVEGLDIIGFDAILKSDDTFVK